MIVESPDPRCAPRSRFEQEIAQVRGTIENRLGGPIIENRAFFFGNFDVGRKATPNGFSVSGTTGQPWGHQDEVARIIAKPFYITQVINEVDAILRRRAEIDS